MRYFSFIFLSLIISLSFAQSKPSQLLIGVPKTSKHAHAVIRYSNTTYELNSIHELIARYNYAITILDNGGRSYSEIVLPYDNFSKISKISVLIYDQLGQMIEKVPERDLEDIPYSSSNLFDDLRLIYYKGLQKKLPITIYVSYKKTYTDFFHLPEWVPQKGSDIMLEKASLKIINNAQLPYRYYAKNFPDSTLINYEEGNTRTWELGKLEAFELEKYGPKKWDQLPSIVFPLDEFQMEGYKGNSTSWEELADWRLQLKKGLLDLKPETVSLLKKMTDTISDKKEKAKIIYKWMQNETRYVSIQLGVGGWKPFSAEFVDEKKYGDCKALTNYTQALLKSVGIDSYYSPIQAGLKDSPIDKNKVYNQFNHIILCIPFDGDTTWLECTSNDAPFGYLGAFTDDRYALVSNKNNSHLIKTPKYLAGENLLQRKSAIKVNEEGGYKGNIQAEFHNIQSEKRWFQKDENLQDQMDNLYQIVDVKGFHINHLKYEFVDQMHPIVYENIDFDARQVARMTNTKILLPLYYLNTKPNRLKNDENRRFDIIQKRGSTSIDTIIYQVPENYQVHSLSDTTILDTDFGYYESNSWMKDDMIYYYRKEIVRDGRFPPERWEDFKNYKNAVRKADKATAVLEVIPTN